VTGRLTVAVAVPVLIGDEVAYVLNAGLSAERLNGMVQLDAVAPPYFAAIADRNGVILARSGANDEFIGKPLPGFADRSEAEGVWTGVSPEGLPATTVYRRSPLTGWLVTVGVSQAALEAPLRHSLWRLGGIGLTLLLVAGALACMVTGAMTRSVRALTDMAQDLGAGRDVRPPQAPIREARRIGTALAEAALALRERDAALAQANRDLERRVAERTRALAESEARYRLLAENASDVIMLKGVGRGARRSYVSPSVRTLLGYEPEEFLALPSPEIIHPDDVERVLTLYAGVGPQNPQAMSVHRLRRKDGGWV
jgi:PAS domain S-box-containing protein